MEYKTITRPDGSEQQLAVYDGKCRFWMEGLYDSLPETAEKRAEECSLPVKIDRRADGTVSVGTQSLVPWETDYGCMYSRGTRFTFPAALPAPRASRAVCSRRSVCRKRARTAHCAFRLHRSTQRKM